MPFQFRTERRPNTIGLDDQILILEDGDGSRRHGSRMEIWPAPGFQWFRWLVQAEQPLDLLYATPQYFQEARPTRSGNPILFPFPNRIRDARFSWGGQSYELPANDAGGRHAIHGFACRHPFRLLDHGADADSAWVRAEFQGSVDAPQERALWPADFGLRITYRFFGRRVRLDAEVFNPDRKDLPWGLGFHPYFALAPYGGEDAVIGSPARAFWELEENLPPGPRQQVSGQRDLRAGKRSGDLKLDDILTDLDLSDVVNGLILLGWVQDAAGKRRLEVRADPAYRDVVVFNPAHRQAICLEPYTCVTDAINLQARGIEAGLRVLQPGQSWQGAVEFALV